MEMEFTMNKCLWIISCDLTQKIDGASDLGFFNLARSLPLLDSAATRRAVIRSPRQTHHKHV